MQRTESPSIFPPVAYFHSFPFSSLVRAFEKQKVVNAEELEPAGSWRGCVNEASELVREGCPQGPMSDRPRHEGLQTALGGGQRGAMAWDLLAPPEEATAVPAPWEGG